MKKHKKQSQIDWLVGSWRAGEGQISVLFDFEKTEKGFRIKAFEESDGERLVVSKVKWDGKVLAFETFMPSTKWRTRNRFTAISKTKAIQELTHWEPWTKVRKTAPK